MKSILVVGLGRFGKCAAKKLHELGHEVLAVDNVEERVNDALPYVTDAMIGDTTSRSFLESLGVSNYDFCLVAIGDNFQNSLETTSLLKEMGAKYVVSRAARNVHKKFLLRNGADEVVYPERQLAEWTAIRYSSDHVFDYIELDESCAIYEIEVPDHWVGHTIDEMKIRKNHGLNIVGIRRDGKVNMEVTPDLVFDKEMRILLAGNRKNIEKCFK